MIQRNACPVCHSTDQEILISLPYGTGAVRRYLENHYGKREEFDKIGHETFELRRCKSCQLSFQQHVPDDELLHELYDQWIPQTERTRLASLYRLDDYRYYAEQVEFLIQHLGKSPSEIKVLDFGLGWAEWAKMAQAYGCTVYGSELSPSRVEHARSNGIVMLEMHELGEHRFDFINTEQVFEHVVDPRALLEQLTSLLSPGGLLKISVPNSRSSIAKAARTRSLDGFTPEELLPIAPLEHVNSFEFKSLVALAASAKLTPIRPSVFEVLNSASGLLNLRRALRLVMRAVYRFVYPKSTFVYFTRAHG